MSTKKPWFPLYAADFLTDTQAMSHAAVGIYIRLLLYQWVNGSIPKDQHLIARIAGCTVSELEDLWVELDFKFEGDASLRNPRLERERRIAEKISETKSKAGRASGVARKNRSEVNDSEHPFGSVGNTSPTKSNQSQSQSHKKPPPASRATPLKRKTRLPEDWRPDEKLLAWAQKNVPQGKIGPETEIFRDYFLGSGGTKLDWRRAWQVWMRKEAKKAHTVKHRMTFEQAERICIREHKTKREGESKDEFIDRMQAVAEGFA